MQFANSQIISKRNVASKAEISYMYKISAWKLQGERSLGRITYAWKATNKILFRENVLRM
jgi:hypothetical protein